VSGTRRDAEAFERRQKERLGNGSYIPKATRQTFAQVAQMFLAERVARARRTSSLACYETVLNQHLLPDFGPREVGTIRRQDAADHFERMRAKGATSQTVNRTLRTLKAVLFFALERELVERNLLQRFRPYPASQGERGVARGAFSEAEVRAIIAAAEPGERALIGVPALAGLRPGEAYATDWADADLKAGVLHVRRSWDHRGSKFVEPKTSAGQRCAPPVGVARGRAEGPPRTHRRHRACVRQSQRHATQPEQPQEGRLDSVAHDVLTGSRARNRKLRCRMVAEQQHSGNEHKHECNDPMEGVATHASRPARADPCTEKAAAEEIRHNGPMPRDHRERHCSAAKKQRGGYQDETHGLV